MKYSWFLLLLLAYNTSFFYASQLPVDRHRPYIYTGQAGPINFAQTSDDSDGYIIHMVMGEHKKTLELLDADSKTTLHEFIILIKEGRRVRKYYPRDNQDPVIVCSLDNQHYVSYEEKIFDLCNNRKKVIVLYTTFLSYHDWVQKHLSPRK